jgi:hypothetical protein
VEAAGLRALREGERRLAGGGGLARRRRSVEGDLVRADDIGARVELLYGDVHDTFDRPHLREWPAFARRGDRVAPAFDGGWTLDPLPIPPPNED